MFRAFYTPDTNSHDEVFEDALTLEELSSGAILVIKMNEDGTRELISEKQKPTKKEKYFVDYAKRQLEFKHDGGDTPEHRAYRIGKRNG